MTFRLRTRPKVPRATTGIPRASKALIPPPPALRGDFSVLFLRGTATPPALPGVTGVKPSSSLSGVGGIGGMTILVFVFVVSEEVVVVTTGGGGDGTLRCMIGMKASVGEEELSLDGIDVGGGGTMVVVAA